METVQGALEAIKKAALKHKVDKEIKDTINHVNSSLVLLKSSSPSVNSKNTLTSLLRFRLVPLYTALPTQALALSVAIFTNISNDKISKLDLTDSEGRSSWEKLQVAILSGILDYLEDTNNDESKDAVAVAFYPTICALFFPAIESMLSSAIIMSVGLRTLAYMLLYESADHHTENQRKLRDPKLLGGKRIGMILSRTNAFLAVETLFTLFARLLPSTMGNDSGRAKRSKFLQEVFLSTSFKCSKELVQILENVSKSAWEETVAILMNVLAKDNIAFPQPFALDEIRACGAVFPQPTPAERLYLDQTCFFGNVVDDSEAYESLQILYADVISIELKSGPGATQVIAKLSAPAIVAEVPMKTCGELALKFDIKNEDIKRFLEALNSRGLGTLVAGGQHMRPKLSLPAQSLTLNAGEEHTLSFEDQVKDVQRRFGLDQSSESGAPSRATEDPGDAASLVKTTPAPMPKKPPTGSDKQPSYAPQPTLRRSNTQIVRDTVFGESDEELSEIEDEASPKVASAKSVPRAKLNSSTIVTPRPVLKSRIMDSDDDVGAPNALQKSHRKGPSKKKAAIVSDAEDDDIKVSKKAFNRNDSPAGRTTRASALADNLEAAAAAAAAKNRQSPIDSNMSTKGSKSLLIIGDKKLSALDSNVSNKLTARNLTRKISIVEVALPASDDCDPRSPNPKETQSVKDAQPAGQPRRPVVPSALKGVLSDLYNLDEVSRATVDEGPVEKSAARTTRTAPGARAAGMKKRTNDADQSIPENTKDIRKRKKATDSGGLDDDNAERPPVKRQRGRAQAQNVVSMSASPKRQSDIVRTKNRISKNRYGKKGRISSPAPSATPAIDYDELPDLVIPSKVETPPPNGKRRPAKEPVRKATAVQVDTGRTRASGMRRKVEKVERPIVPTVMVDKPEPKARRKRTSKADKVKAIPVKTIDQHEEQHVAKPKTAEPKNGKKGTKSANTTAVQTEDVEKQTGSKEDGAGSIKHIKPRKAPWEAPDFMEIVPVDPAIDYQTNHEDEHGKTDEFDTALPDADPVEFAVSTTGPFPESPTYASTPQKDVIMIDLTRDDSPLETNEAPHTHNAIEKTADSTQNISDPPPDSPKKILQSKSTTRPRHNVTFAPIVESRSPSPFAYHQNQSVSISRTEIKRSQRMVDTPRNEKNEQNYYQGFHKKRSATQRDGEELQNIVDVLNEIQTEVIRNMSNKFEGVKKDVHIGRDRILREATSNLHEMRSKCVRHFNALVDMEKDYAVYCQKSAQGWEDVNKISQEICQFVNHTIEDHDRNSLSKKLPKSLFSDPFPLNLRKPLRRN